MNSLRILACCGLATAAGAAPSVTPLFESGDTLPNAEPFEFAYDAVINNDGVVAFTGRFTGGANDEALFTGTPGSIQAIAIEGETAPGTAFPYNTSSFEKTGPLRLAPSGTLLSFAAQLEVPNQPDPANVGVWDNRTGQIESTVFYGDPDPGAAGETLNGFEKSWYAPDGRSVFFAFGSVGSGLFSDTDTPGDFQRLAFEGDTVPGLNPGETLQNFSFPHANRHGQFLVMVSLNGSSDNILLGGDITTGELQALVREGDAINNSSQSVGSFNNIGDNELINANGTIAFGHFGSSFSGGIVIGDLATGLRTVGERGQPIGDTGLTFNSELISKPKLKNNDEVSFVGRIQGASSANDRAIFIADQDLAVTMFLREGDPVPGLTDVNFGSPPNNSSRPDHLFNDSGIVVAGMPLSGPGVSPSSNYAVVYGTGPDDLAVLLRTGDDFGDGSGRTISNIVYADSLTHDGSPAALNSRDEFIVNIDFTDGSSGLYIVDLSPPTCPADLNGDGVADADDFFAYLGIFADGC